MTFVITVKYQHDSDTNSSCSTGNNSVHYGEKTEETGDLKKHSNSPGDGLEYWEESKTAKEIYCYSDFSEGRS